MSWDPYLDLNSGVLRNRLGVTDPEQLARAEATLTTLRTYELRRSDLSGSYDLPHLQLFHHWIFLEVYDWAGELRTVSLGRGALFCLPRDIRPTADTLFGRLAAMDHLRGLDREEFVDELTTLLAGMTYLHPFREGNGRAQRAFLSQLARQAGYSVRWSEMGREENVTASRAAHHSDLTLLRDLLDRLVEATRPSPPRR